MDELLKRRLDRALEGLPDDKVRQLIDYVEFLKSKYADRSSQPSTIEMIANRVEDTLRVGKAPMAAIRGTRDVLDTADKVVRGIADAGRTVVGEISDQLKQATGATSSDSKKKDEEEPASSDEEDTTAT